VYRGAAIPSLAGKFVFGDYGSGRILSVEPDGMGGSTAQVLLDTSFSIASFGQLANGEVFVLDIASGRIHQLVPTASDGGVAVYSPQFPSQTGSLQSSDPKPPKAGLIP